MDYAFCSFSFHRLLAEGKQDIFQYIKDCKDLGACQLDAWNAHLAQIMEADEVLKAGNDPENAELAPVDDDYLKRVKDAAVEAGLPWGCIACDGAHIYEEDEGDRKLNRAIAYRWLDIAEFLGARQVRIDAGGPVDMPDEAYKVIVGGYNDLISRARDKGIEVVTENHWGPTTMPDNIVKLMENIEGLGLLFDTNNWAEGHQEEGWEGCAKYATATHVKTFCFDEDGWDPTVDLKKCIGMLVEVGYDDVWGIESCPREIGEMEGAKKSVELIRRALAACGK